MPSKPAIPINRVTMLNITIFLEAFLLLAATVWSQSVGLSLAKSMLFSYKFALMGIGAGVAMALAGGAVYWLTRNVAAFEQLKDLVENYLHPMVTELEPADLFTVAAVSGFCEEVFFRGVIQPQFGLPMTALAFGIFHDPSFRNLSYSIIACLYGLVLGWLFQFTGDNLWAPIFAHSTHNLISLFFLRYWIKPPASPVGE